MSKSEAMIQCIGVKLINAIPMSRAEYNDLRGWVLPSDENGEDAGYLVEYLDGGKANHPDFVGYISWSPADVFKKEYRKTNGLTFGLAIEALKLGKKVARAGWNGNGMWLSYSPGAPALPYYKFWSKASCEYAYENGGYADVLPCITMKTATGEILMGWLASQTDMLADDWLIVE